MITDKIYTEVEYILEFRTPNSGKDWEWFQGCKPFLKSSQECALDLLNSVRSKGYPLTSPVKHEYRLVKETKTTDYGDPNSVTQITREVLDF